MLPLEGVFFIPSLFVTPIAVAAFFFLRKGQDYPQLWRNAVMACFVLTAIYTILTLSTPLYSERDQTPNDPGGFSVSPWAVIGELVFWTCAVIPSFFVLIALACLPPRGWSRLPLIAGCLLYVVVLGWMIAHKNARFIADYEQAKIQERARRIEARQLMREQWRRP